MNIKSWFFSGILLFGFSGAFAQEIITVPHNEITAIKWQNPEKSYFSEIWQNEVVTNVSVPTMEVFRPKEPNGTSVIVAPGGGLYALSIQSEGTDVARWLNQKGITAFVLKYRLVPTGEDGVREITEEGNTNPQRIGERVAPILPLSIADGLAAIEYVRNNAEQYGISKDKIGFMGFSAGGAVTMGVTFNYNQNNRPDFIVPVYPWMTVIPAYSVPKDAPPMMVVCATDDPLGLAKPSALLYMDWLAANHSVGMHMFAKGGHGFGMKKQGLASDNWIAYVHEWMITQGLVTNTVKP
jgi:acetyl esterase/lipase